MTIIRTVFYLCLVMIATGAWADSTPVLIGIDAEFSVVGSTSAQAIRLGAQIAVDEINADGGVLGGRPLALVPGLADFAEAVQRQAITVVLLVPMPSRSSTRTPACT